MVLPVGVAVRAAGGVDGVWPSFIGQSDPGACHGHRHYTGDADAGLGTFTVPSVPAKPRKWASTSSGIFHGRWDSFHGRRG